MRVVVPVESAPGERRVALTPEVVQKLSSRGFELVVERGAGSAAGFDDAAYEKAGASIGDDSAVSSDGAAVARVASPTADEVARLAPGAVLVGFLAPLSDPDGIERLRARGVVAFAMESIPRITRAQSMDALSSQATVAGYKAVLLAADRSPKMSSSTSTKPNRLPCPTLRA